MIFQGLVENTKDCDVECCEIAIGKEDKVMEFFANDTYYGTLEEKELDRWKDTDFQFISIKVHVLTYETFYKAYPYSYDLISIDADGLDYYILSQIDLSKTSMVIVEYNGKDMLKYREYCEKFGLKLRALNGENLVFTYGKEARDTFIAPRS